MITYLHGYLDRGKREGYPLWHGSKWTTHKLPRLHKGFPMDGAKAGAGSQNLFKGHHNMIIDTCTLKPIQL